MTKLTAEQIKETKGLIEAAIAIAIKPLLERIAILEQASESATQAINSYSDAISSNTEAIKNVTPTNLNSIFSKKTETESLTNVALIHQLQQEQEEQTRIENNIVIDGVEVDEDDLDDHVSVENILKAVGSKIGDTARISRLYKTDKKQQKTPTNRIIVTFKTYKVKENVIKNAKTLRNNTCFDGVYINSDRTRAQRMIDYTIRQQRKNLNRESNATLINGRHLFKEKGVEYEHVYRGGIFFKRKFLPKD